MTKKELARKVAENMKEIRTDINVERMTKVLMNGMTTHELKMALAHRS